MELITIRYTADELHEMALETVDFNNVIVGDDEDRLFPATPTRAFYIDENKDLFLMEVEGNQGTNLKKINPEHLEAMFVLYENVADALRLENE